VTSVYISHATPGAWLAHNDSRSNGFAIADESLWGDPNTTGTPAVHTSYQGGHGNSEPGAEVVIGSGHPNWRGDLYVNSAMRGKLTAENGLSGAFSFVERIAGSPDGGARLLAKANQPEVLRLAGLFGSTEGNLEYRLADGSGHNSENPTLAEMTEAALEVLGRDEDGFVLLVEGGAIDWAAHANNMNKLLGEVTGFNQSVQSVIDWVENPGNDSTWDNTLVIVTADHETGYLAARPGVFPDQPLGEISQATMLLEKPIGSTGLRASWQDADSDSQIDVTEMVYWAWNSSGHTNSLVPLFAEGAGSELFIAYATSIDPVRGSYLDNTDIFRVVQEVTFDTYHQASLCAYLPFIVLDRNDD
jgi:alkaline phosphatase